MATLKDHTPYPIPHPQLLQLGWGGGRNGTERTNALPRAGLAGNKTTRRRWVRSTRPQTVLPSCAHTHLHSQPPACAQVPLQGAQRLPTAGPPRWKPRHVHSDCLERGRSSAPAPTLPGRSHPALGLVLSCRCKPGVSPTRSRPFVQQHARVREQSTARLRAQSPGGVALTLYCSEP